jgi:hypothetical protein
MGVSAKVRTSTNTEKGAGYSHNEAPGTASFWPDSGDLVPDEMKPVAELSNVKDGLGVA